MSPLIQTPPQPSPLLTIAQASAPPDLTPQQQLQLLVALAAEVHQLRQELARARVIILAMLTFLLGSSHADKLLALIGG